MNTHPMSENDARELCARLGRAPADVARLFEANARLLERLRSPVGAMIERQNALVISSLQAGKDVGTVSGPICKACAELCTVKPYRVTGDYSLPCRGCGRLAVGFAIIPVKWGETMQDAIARVALTVAQKSEVGL